MNRKYVVTLEVTCDDSKDATFLRRIVKIFAGRISQQFGLRLTTHTVDGPVPSEPVVLMERILP